MSAKITDAQAKEVQSLANSTIHELVFAAHHVEDDQTDEALECLVAVNINLQRMAEILEERRCTPSYVIVRRPDPGNPRDKLRFITMGGGWGHTVAFALTFRTEAAARAQLGSRIGEIVTADSIGLELKP